MLRAWLYGIGPCFRRRETTSSCLVVNIQRQGERRGTFTLFCEIPACAGMTAVFGFSISVSGAGL